MIFCCGMEGVGTGVCVGGGVRVTVGQEADLADIYSCISANNYVGGGLNRSVLVYLIWLIKKKTTSWPTVRLGEGGGEGGGLYDNRNKVVEI